MPDDARGHVHYLNIVNHLEKYQAVADDDRGHERHLNIINDDQGHQRDITNQAMVDEDSGYEHQLATISDKQGHQRHLKTIHNQGPEDLAFINPNSKDKYPQPQPQL
jgi:hypothetical protein